MYVTGLLPEALVMATLFTTTKVYDETAIGLLNVKSKTKDQYLEIQYYIDCSPLAVLF